MDGSALGERPAYDSIPRLTTEKAKGIHLILPRLNRGDCGIATFTRAEKHQNEKPRIIFTLSFDDALSAVGTTESDPERDPDSVRPSATEVDYLLSEVNRIFPVAAVNRASIVSAYAGVRPLIAPKGEGFVSREHLITESKSGVMYIYGGKLTTHRKIAEEAVDRITEELDVRAPAKPLHIRWGWHWARVGWRRQTIPTADRERISGRYGGDTAAIAKFIAEDRTLAEPISESSAFLKAEVVYALWGEMAMTLDDLLWRRLRIGFTPGQGVDLAPKIARFLGERGHWNEERIASEVKSYTRAHRPTERRIQEKSIRVDSDVQLEMVYVNRVRDCAPASKSPSGGVQCRVFLIVRHQATEQEYSISQVTAITVPTVDRDSASEWVVSDLRIAIQSSEIRMRSS